MVANAEAKPAVTSGAALDFGYRLLDPKGNDYLGEAPDKQRRLQALIANWLRMENVVCVLGAGCSKSDAIKGLTIQELESAVLNTMASKWKDNKDVAAFIEDRKQQAKKGIIGFEQWLTILSNASNLVSMKGTPVPLKHPLESRYPSHNQRDQRMAA